MLHLAGHAANCFPDKPFFLCADEKMPSVTGAELYGYCKKAAAVLEEFTAEQHIALLGPGSAAWLTAYFAVLSAGRVIVPLHDGMQQQELEDCLRLADCGLLLYDERRGETAALLAQAIPGLALLELHEFVERLREEKRESLPKLEPNAVAAMYFTSGTTGKPRCVLLTHRNMGSQVSAVTEVIPLSETDVGLSLLPLSHTFEIMTHVAGALHCGGTLYLNESVRTVKKNLREKRPTILVAVPLILQTLHKEILTTARKQGRLDALQNALCLSDSLRKIGLNMSGRLFGEVKELLGGRLHTIICGGAALDPELIRFFRALGIEVLQGYGITECSPVVSVNRPGKNVVGSVGRPLPCCEVKLDGREICVRGDSVSPGYYKDEKATTESFRDGWFHTGDLGRLDPMDNLFFEGRIKNLIILANGENVSPEELEEKLYQTEGILDAAVYEKDGRITAELFVDRALIPDIPAAWRIVSPINRSLASFKQIGDIVLRETEFEKTATRKIKRYKLKGN
ncbi:MAG: AMP-binding protein [Oscillospiraceae bacterium]|nr:AMP-binding protein [Oscillospiraceae bacterium]